MLSIQGSQMLKWNACMIPSNNQNIQKQNRTSDNPPSPEIPIAQKTLDPKPKTIIPPTPFPSSQNPHLTPPPLNPRDPSNRSIHTIIRQQSLRTSYSTSKRNLGFNVNRQVCSTGRPDNRGKSDWILYFVVREEGPFKGWFCGDLVCFYGGC